MEFLQGTDPPLSDAARPDRSQSRVFPGENSVSPCYENRTDRKELNPSYQLEASDDLVSWTPMPNGSASQKSLSSPWRRTTLAAQTVAERAFYRVRASHRVLE